MRRNVRPTKSYRHVVLLFAAVGALIVGIFIPQANAMVSNYSDVSPRISGTTDTEQARLWSPHSVSGDGRYVVFSSDATNFVANDTNGTTDVFVTDTQTSTVTRISVSTSGMQANGYSSYPSISYSGRYVVFTSVADNLVAGVTGSSTHTYIRDLVNNTTTLVDTSASGSVNDRGSVSPKISADGRFVVFASNGTNLVPGVPSYISQIYVKDMHTGAIKALSRTSTGVTGNQDSNSPDISCDGNTVAFTSKATNLGVPDGQQGRWDIIVVNLGWSGDELGAITSSTDWGAIEGSAQVSCDGNVVMFTSSSTNVVPPGTPFGYLNVYQYNRLNSNVIQVSLGNGNTQPNTPQQGLSIRASMSGDGRYVAFSSAATNVDTTYPNVSGDGSYGSIYIRDTKKSTSETATILPNGHRSGWASAGEPVSMSGDGSKIVFAYSVPNTYNTYRSLVSGLNSGSPSFSYRDIFSAETNH